MRAKAQMLKDRAAEIQEVTEGLLERAEALEEMAEAEPVEEPVEAPQELPRDFTLETTEE